jgi:hypothetical protein
MFTVEGIKYSAKKISLAPSVEERPPLRLHGNGPA